MIDVNICGKVEHVFRIDERTVDFILGVRDDIIRANSAALAQVESRLLRVLIKQEQDMSLDYSRLSAAVAQNTSVTGSIDATVKGLAQQLRDQSTAATDLADAQAKMNAFADALEANNSTIQADVVANTPATGGATDPNAPPATGVTLPDTPVVPVNPGDTATGTTVQPRDGSTPSV